MRLPAFPCISLLVNTNASLLVVAGGVGLLWGFECFDRESFRSRELAAPTAPRGRRMCAGVLALLVQETSYAVQGKRRTSGARTSTEGRPRGAVNDWKE